ncbi:hypothetical protein HC928_09650 [bacterium]|nr:hypothetical protein [bacterium]
MEQSTGSVPPAGLPVLWCWFVVLLCSSCAGVGSPTYIVPDGYSGFLVIRYDCPDGKTVTPDSPTITFEANGTACLRGSYSEVNPSAVFASRAETYRGQSIPFRGNSIANRQEFALVDIAYKRRGTRTSTGIVRSTFSVLWVGHLDELAALQRAGDYEKELYDFINNNFDLPQPGS